MSASPALFADLDLRLSEAAVAATGPLVVVVAGVATWLAAREVWGWWRHRQAWDGAARVEILAAPRVDPAGAVVFWQHLLGLLPPRHRAGGGGHVVFEYEFTADGLAISVWVPGTVAAGLVAAAARSAWPGARTRTSPAPRPPARPRPGRGDRDVYAAGGRLRLARPPGLPIEIEHRADPIRALIGAAGRPALGQTGRVQILARPLSGARLAAVARHERVTPTRLFARALTAGAGAVATLTQEVVSLAVNGPARPGTRTSRSTARRGHGRERAPGAGRLVDSAQDRATAAKAHGSGGGFSTAVRYLVTTTSHGTGRDERRAARAVSARRAHALASAFAEFSGHNHYRRRPLTRPARTVEQRRLRGGDPLSVAEIAALAHLPTDDHVPGLRRAGAAAIAPPPQIPATGPQIRPLGDSDLLTDRPVGLSVPDARHHLWVIGATGAGKSTLCVHGVLADAAAGRAAIVLDPKGDLVTDIVARLPAAARARTVLIDPDHPAATGPLWPCLNPLTPAYPGTESRPVGDAAVENVTTVFSRVFATAWGHRSEDLLRVACLTLRAGPGPASLAQLPALLTDATARRRAVAHLDPTGRLAEFWAWFDHLADSSRAQISAPLLNKLRAILLRPFAEALLCGPSTVDLPRLLDNGGLLLVRLPKGALGEDTVRLIGSLLVAQIWQAALARAHQPEHRRRDASLLLDECQNFLHLPYRIEDMLAEARGFRLSITLAHQHLAQLTPALRDGIATNARNKIMFAVSPDDAAVLARHTLPELGAHDLAHLDGFHAAAHLLADGAETRAFTLTTRPLPPPPIPPQPRPAPATPLRRPSPRLDRSDPRR